MANNNLMFREFETDMEKMGFTCRDGAGDRKIYASPSGYKITVHIHGAGCQTKADTLRQVKQELERIGWFNDRNNFKLFPFKKWQFSPNSVKIDKTVQDIDDANELYKDAHIERVFYGTPNLLCYIETENGVNLCRSNKDRRPLLDRWFTKIEPAKCHPYILCLKYDNYETFETECYPINQDGTLDMDNIIIED